MQYTFLNVTDSDTTRIVTIDRPQSLNALNAQVVSELSHFFGQDKDAFEGCRAIILTGSGSKAFVAGADIGEIKALSSAQGVEFAKIGHRMMDSIERFHLPVIAAINGFALGGGCELALACHIRLASEHARMGLPEVNLGLIPGYGGTQRLAKTVGKGNAMFMTLTADMVDAENALRMGLVSKVCKSDELLEEALKVAAKISTKGPLAVEAAIATINASSTDAGFKQEVELFGRLIGSEDAGEGTTAFLEKRKAEFKGR